MKVRHRMFNPKVVAKAKIIFCRNRSMATAPQATDRKDKWSQAAREAGGGRGQAEGKPALALYAKYRNAGLILNNH